ncbi:hypothetical protein SDC9_186424 [bioreactor metagenome]|uniref:Uncharacterized protein n=1 Tax=bioreactor metagenome TaxID=1076179 RepID=A0A645HKZ8_9ZZZZ
MILLAEARQENHRRGCDLPQLPAEIITRPVRQHHIQHHNIRRLMNHRLFRLTQRLSGDDLIALPRQMFCIDLQNPDLILHHKDSWLSIFHIVCLRCTAEITTTGIVGTL